MPIIEQAHLGSGAAVQPLETRSRMKRGWPSLGKAAPPANTGGKSCRDRIRELRDEGFFTEQRGISDIVRGLNSSGHPDNVNQVGAA